MARYRVGREGTPHEYLTEIDALSSVDAAVRFAAEDDAGEYQIAHGHPQIYTVVRCADGKESSVKVTGAMQPTYWGDFA